MSARLGDCLVEREPGPGTVFRVVRAAEALASGKRRPSLACVMDVRIYLDHEQALRDAGLRELAMSHENVEIVRRARTPSTAKTWSR